MEEEPLPSTTKCTVEEFRFDPDLKYLLRSCFYLILIIFFVVIPKVFIPVRVSRHIFMFAHLVTPISSLFACVSCNFWLFDRYFLDGSVKDTLSIIAIILIVTGAHIIPLYHIFSDKWAVKVPTEHQPDKLIHFFWFVTALVPSILRLVVTSSPLCTRLQYFVWFIGVLFGYFCLSRAHLCWIAFREIELTIVVKGKEVGKISLENNTWHNYAIREPVEVINIQRARF